MSFYPTSYYNTGTGITNIQATDVSAATVEASTAFSGPGTGLTGTATSLTAGLAQNLTGSPAVSVSSITSSGTITGPGTGLTGIATSLTAGLAQNLTGSPAVSVSSLTSTGSVGVGTTATSSALNVGTGLTTNLGNGLSTQYDTTTATAATITGGYNTGSGPTPNTPTTGEYQWTIGSTTTYGDMVSLGLYPPGATFTWSFTARGTSAGFTVQTVPNSVTVFTSPALTSTYQTFTWTATIPSNGNGNIYFVVYGASGQNIIWNAFSATRLDTIVTGYLGLGKTNPQYTLDVNGTGNFASSLTLPGQPSFSYYVSNFATTGTGLVSPFTSSSTTNAAPRGITWNSAVIVPSVAGRYLLTVTGQVSGNGSVFFVVTNPVSGSTITMWNGTASNTPVSLTMMYDFTGTSSSYTSVIVSATSGTFTINWMTFTGQMIG